MQKINSLIDPRFENQPMPEKADSAQMNPDKMSKVPILYFNENGKVFCSARRATWTPDNPHICLSLNLMANGRCKRHGGASLVGAASPRFIHGATSKYLPKRMLERFQEALADPELLSLAESLAVNEARLCDLYSKADEGGSSEIFKSLGEAWESLKYANQDGDRAKQIEAARKVDEHMRAGKKEELIWHQVAKLTDLKRKLVVAEASRMRLLNQTITVAEAHTWVVRLIEAVNEEVENPDVRRRISEKVRRINIA